MEKRYQVFVSSTYEDLQAERREVMQALLELDCIPSGMELFPAADDDQWSLIKGVIDDCDYYIVIIAGRYGSRGNEGKSYTQMEYEYAVSRGKPVIAFLHAHPGKIPSERSESTPEGQRALDDFRQIVKKKVCKTFTTPQDLGSVISRSIVKLIKEKPGIGWVRADMVPTESAAQEILRLKSESEELKRTLERLRVEPPKGSEGFAQGEDVIQVHFGFDRDNHHRVEAYECTWNELFSVLGPCMTSSRPESSLKDKLNEFYKNRQLDRHNVRVYNVSVRDEDFQRIKIQLKALGLIRMSDTLEWILTPYGDDQLTQIVAIRRADSQ